MNKCIANEDILEVRKVKKYGQEKIANKNIC